MNKYAKRPLYVALTTVAALAATSVLAVNVSSDGRGQVLLYPYYTTRADAGGNAYGTLLSVVNASGSAKAVRVRFLEGKIGREVLDFNLFLSPFDVWASAILPDPATGGARLGSIDLSCTLPSFSASSTAPFVTFANTGYSGANDDGAGTGLDRTKEGYFEIIEMATYAPPSPTAIAITHVNGIPPCSRSGNTALTDTQAALDARPPSGGLFGALTLINVSEGTDYTADAVALDNFFQGGSNYHASTETMPDLTQGTPPMSSVQAPNGLLYESTWAAGTADAVSAILMHDSLMNEYVLDSATRSGTDWVVTMPTKRYYVNVATGNATKLFQRNFRGGSGACDDLSSLGWCGIVVIDGIYDREERKSVPGGLCGVPPPSIVPALCWAANDLTFNSANVLGSTSSANSNSPFQNGWVNMGFATGIAGADANVHRLINNGATSISGGGHATATGNSATYVGLPAIGFAVVSFTNGTLQIGTPPVTVLSNYGGNFVHKTNTTIQ